MGWHELGYDVGSVRGRESAAEDVIAQIVTALPSAPARKGNNPEFGQRFEVDVVIQGPNGRRGTLLTVWQYDIGSRAPRMITNFIKVHKQDEERL